MHTLEQLRSGALAGVRRLDLSCNLQTVPPEVFDLADSLEVLNLSGNQLTSLPHDLPRLHRLKVIFCSNNPFTELPEVLGECANLQMVGFKSCRIARVSAAALPVQLRWFILTDNAVSQVPDALGERPALQKLMLAGNRLRALPDSLAHAERLELLRLSANQFESLPEWLTRLPRLSWLALAGNALGWHHAQPAPLDAVHWRDLQVNALLGEGASGHIYRVHHRRHAEGLALKLFKGLVTSDGLPEHELAACLAAGQHPALCTPTGELTGHPDGARGLLLPLIAPSYINLAGPPSLESCTRDVYPSGLRIEASTALRLASQLADAVTHLHARGVMHGDLYAHNILWDPHTAQALLSDFGGATLLPDGSKALRRALLALEVRAFGYLLEELLVLVETAEGRHDPVFSCMTALAQACTNLVPAQRPDMAEVAAQLAALA
ncbi:MAG: protein kinase [Burkholderiales bacterium]|nr:protein kinase [Burkholderiales bacterium]